jgi:2-polyprenyl-6-methoxyphenol hydroxylase-like FAD-dependent oxidoreductase
VDEEDRGILLSGPTAASVCEDLRSLDLLEEALTCAILENTGLEDTDEGHYPAKSSSFYGHSEQEVVSTRDKSVPEQKLVDYDGSKPELPRRIYYSDLHKILVKAAKRTDEIFWGVTAQNIIEQTGERLGVWLTANKGEHWYFSRCDYVVAADGASSTTRACLLSRSTPMMAKYQVGGVATFPGGIPKSLQTWGTRTAKDWVDHTPFCSYQAVDEHHVIWDVNSAEPMGDPNALDDLEESKWVLELCDRKVQGMITIDSKRERLRTLFENTHPRALFSFADGEKRTFSNLSDRGVVFIGDSNHATSKGYADGWGLAKVLVRSGDVHGAIKAYRDASAARASRELGFWGQGALNTGFGGIVSVFSAIRLVGNLFLIFLKSD